MAKRQIKGVRFNGEASDLQALIGCWNVMKGVRWSVTPTDYVGGSFDVTFARDTAPISQAEAQAWVDAALKHAGE